jgi:hypothetical protein
MPRPLGFSEQYTMAGAAGFVQASIETFARTPSSEKSEVLIEVSPRHQLLPPSVST